MLKPILSLIGEKNRIHMFLLLPVMLVGSLLEIAGVGLMVSVCALLMSGSRLQQNPAVLWVCGRLGVQPGRQLIVLIPLALVVLYVGKLLYLTWENGTEDCFGTSFHIKNKDSTLHKQGL